MALESATYISDLVSTNPVAADPKSQGDDHLRLIKATVKATFPNISGAVTPTHTELNYVDGVTSAIQTQIDSKGAHAGQTWTGTHTFPSTTSIGNVSDTEISYLDGVTSAIQTQLNTLTSAKGAIAGQTWTGTHDYTGATLQAATQTAGDSSTKVATTAFVGATAFSAALPSQTGNSGKFVTTNGTTASWADAKISNVVTSTTATTLTSTGTLLKITPASYGVTVTLPDATTCSVGGPIHIIDNRGAYPVRVCDSTGTLKGFIFAGVVSHISLDDASTAAGVWAIENNELVGASAQLLTVNMLAIYQCVDIGSSREVLVGRGGSAYVYAVVYDRSTNTFGSVTLVRSAAVIDRMAAVSSATNQVLIVSCDSGGTAFEAVTLSISGTTITVNTAATATLSAAHSAFADGCALIAVGSSFVTSYTVATPAAQIRALSISGTTVTIGSATVLSGTAGGLIVSGDSTHVIAASTATTNLYTTPYLVSGSSLTLGTGTTTTSGTMTLSKLAALGTRWFVGYLDGTSVNGAVVSLASAGNGTTTITTAVMNATGTSFTDAIVVGSSKVLIINSQTTNNANILTDTAGTASAGTAITLSSQTTRACLYASSTDVAVQEGTTTYLAHMVSCSGASPVLTKTITTGGSNVEASAFSVSNSVLSRSPKAVYGTAYARNLWMSAVTQNFDPEVNGGVFRRREHINVPGDNTTPGVAYRGKSASEIWITDASTVITKVECV